MGRFLWAVGVFAFFGCVGIAFAEPPQALTLRDLMGHPERFPAKIHLKNEADFGGDGKIPAGGEVGVANFNGASVTADSGKGFVFEVPAEETDLLEVANAQWAKLTPDQRAVDLTMIEQDSSLWPETVTNTSEIGLADGSRIATGTELTVVRMDPGLVVVVQPNSTLIVPLEPSQTDLFQQARERAAIPPAERSSRMAMALEGKAVNAQGQPTDVPNLNTATVFALYRGASWCGPCRTFSPDLVKFAQTAAEKHPGLAIVMISADEKPADMTAYMAEEKMPWPAVPHEEMKTNAHLGSYFGQFIPELIVVDRYGKVLASTTVNGRYVGPQAVLKHMDSVMADR